MRTSWPPRGDSAIATRTSGGTRERSIIELHDLVATAIIVSLRRAHDLADAITARGGIGAINESQDGSRGWRDVVTLVGVTAIVVVLLIASRH